MTFEKKFTILIVLVFGAMVYCSTIANKRQISARVVKVDKIEKVKRYNSGITTDVYYLVFTTKGVFKVNISGLLARPQLVGKIKQDSLYKFELVGVEIPLLGVYSKVLEVSKK